MSQLPAAVTIPELPTGATPTGTELLEAVQGGNSVNLTATQIASAPMSPKSANLVLAGPASGVAAVPTFRALVAADIPAPLQRAVATVADLPVRSTDQRLNVTTAVPLAVTIPLASSRAGVPLDIKDIAGTGVGNISISRTGSDTFDGMTSYTFTLPFERVRLVPANDGVNSGYSFE